MADDAEIAFALAEARVARALTQVAAALPEGVSGICHDCGEQMPRLIGGRCGFCRDGRRPPRSASTPTAPKCRRPSSPRRTYR